MPISNGNNRVRNILICTFIVVIWVILDIVSKSQFSSYETGQVIGGPYFGIFQLTLVHNTGAAWGIFENNPFVLGVFSLVVCLACVVYLVFASENSIGAVVGLSLVVAGGIGNVIDRFQYGYVIDFIEPTFIEFPVFNVADIGVTCGLAIFIISAAFKIITSSKTEEETK